jgi:asparagine synthase (glutamine-hydrolysing)
MCGIAGIVTNAELDSRALTRMAEALAHRGPDGEGFLISDLEARLEMVRRPAHAPAGRPAVGLAHRRLSIIDLSSHNDQPMVDDTGGLAIAFNGEIYNYRELREELASHGHRFRTSGDTEVALLSYAQWGPECVERFVGMWALAICDRRQRQLILSRDRFGIKPLYWTMDSQRLLFASEIKALLASGLVAARPNERIVAHYLAGGRVDADADAETFYAGIHQFPAATTSIISLCGGRLAPRQVHYWSLPDGPRDPAHTGLDGASREVRAALEDSLRLHVRSDVPVGTCLSGGVDSSGVVCLADSMRSELGPAYAHKGFGYVPPDRELSEQSYMESVAQRCQIEMTYASPSRDEFLRAVTDVAASQDEPFGSASVAAQWFVFRAAAQEGVKVMLDGQGADEIFGGYHHYLRVLATDLLMQGRSRELVRLMRDATAAVGKPPYPMWVAPAAMLPRALKRRAHAALRARMAARSPVSERLRRIAGDGPVNPTGGLDAILRADVQHDNLPALLRYEDRNSMAHSIEARVPYLDHRLVELAFRLPVDTRMAGAQPKRVLREALRDVLPPIVLQRRDKIGFRASPGATWALAKEMRAELVRNGDGPAGDWLSVREVSRLLELSSPAIEDEFALWRAVNAKLWARRLWG